MNRLIAYQIPIETTTKVRRCANVLKRIHADDVNDWAYNAILNEIHHQNYYSKLFEAKKKTNLFNRRIISTQKNHQC